MKGKLKPLAWVVVLALLGGIGACGRRAYKKMLVRRDLGDFLRTVGKGDLSLNLQESGELVSRDTVDVFPPGKGFIVEVLKKEGQFVGKGDKIMMFKGGERIDSTQYVPVPIVAPRAGLLTRCVARYGGTEGEIREGKRVDGASNCVTRVVDMKALAVNLEVGEIDVYKLKTGMPVTITFTSIPGEKFEGRVDVVAPMAENRSSNWGGSSGSKVFRVVINIVKPDMRMRVGMSSVVTAPLEAKKDVLKAPIEVLFQEGLNHYVYRQTEGYDAEKLQVFPGLRSETEVEIVGPVKPGDTLFTAAPDSLR